MLDLVIVSKIQDQMEQHSNDEQKKLAVIGASYLQEPLVRKAKEMGLYTICFAWADGAACADICDKFYDISIIEKEHILEICQKEKINGIATIASDIAAPTVAYIANRMGLVANDYEAALRANNKYLMRDSFMEAGVPCPLYKMVTSVQELEGTVWNYPLIVKPSDRSGSLGVTKVISKNELKQAVENALSVSFKKQAMVEEFIEGREISVEFISYNGIHYPLQITDKVTTEAPHFVELEHHQPSTLSPEMYEKIYSITKKALNALAITNGASHAEYKITNEGRIAVMEIGGRMGGDFIGSDLVRHSTGYDFLKGVIEVALGEFEEPHITEHKYSGVYFLCKETIRLLPLIENWKDNPAFVAGEITDKDIREVEKSADRSGYVIYKSNKRLSL